MIYYSIAFLSFQYNMNAGSTDAHVRSLLWDRLLGVLRHAVQRYMARRWPMQWSVRGRLWLHPRVLQRDPASHVWRAWLFLQRERGCQRLASVPGPLSEQRNMPASQLRWLVDAGQLCWWLWWGEEWRHPLK